MGLLKYIVVQQDRADRMERWLNERLGVKVENMGYTDLSTTTITLRIRTRRTPKVIRDAIWERFMEADVRDEDPREKFGKGTWD